MIGIDFDVQHAVLTQSVMHPQTCAVVAHVGQPLFSAMPALNDVGADHVCTSIGVVSISEELC